MNNRKINIKILDFFNTISVKLNVLFEKTTLILPLSLLCAAFTCFSIYSQTGESITLSSMREIKGVNVEVDYDENAYEVLGLPTNCNITISGTAAAVNSLNTKSAVCVLNLSEYGEGEYLIPLVAKDVGNNIKTSISPENVRLSIKKKINSDFTFDYEFTNLNKLDPKLELSEPNFESNTVTITASQDTLNSIAFVKALIDISEINTDSSYSLSAKLIAYDNNGNKINADFTPNDISTTIIVTKPNVDLNIEYNLMNSLPKNKSIDNIVFENDKVKVYAHSNNLQLLNSATVNIDLSELIDSKIIKTFPLVFDDSIIDADFKEVSGVIELGDTETKEIKNVKIEVLNQKSNSTLVFDTVNLTAFGTMNNLNKLNNSDVKVFVDYNELTKNGTLPLHIVCSNDFVSIETNLLSNYIPTK